MNFTLSKRESVLGKNAKDGGFYFGKREGLLSIITREGVSDVLGRRIMDGGLGLDLGREREGFRPGIVAAAAALHCRQ